MSNMPREFWKKIQIPSSRDERCSVIKVITSACEQLLGRFPMSSFHEEKGQELGDNCIHSKQGKSGWANLQMINQAMSLWLILWFIVWFASGSKQCPFAPDGV